MGPPVSKFTQEKKIKIKTLLKIWQVVYQIEALDECKSDTSRAM